MKKFIPIFYTISSLTVFSLLSSCTNSNLNASKTEIERGLIEICHTYNIPTDSTILIITPPAGCKACQVNVLVALDSLPKAYILHSRDEECYIKLETQKCIPYTPNDLEKKGLVKFYSVEYIIVKNKVVKELTLVK